MKRRVIHPYKILAVALGAGVGCSSSARPDPAPATTTSAATRVTAPAVSPANAADAAAIAAAVATPGAPDGANQHTPPTDDKADPKLLTLRTELDQESIQTALTKQDHYRPLCDKDGYPLVGNLNRKGPGPPGASPSAFCAGVRSKKPA